MSNVESVFDQNFKSLALFRVVFSIYLLAEFLSYSGCCFWDFYGETGISPIAALAANARTIADVLGYQVARVFELSRLSFVFPFLYPAAVVAFGIGYKTRWSNAIVFVLHTYLFVRSPHIVYGADVLAHLMLIWCLFLPLSRYWSIDAALDSAPRDRPYPSLPFAAIKVQASSIYVFPALIKLAGGPWRGGYALIWALSDDMFGGTSPGLFLVHNAPELLYFLNYAVILFQLSFPLLVFSPWRNHLTRAIALLCAAAMHISFIFCLNIGAFPYISLTILLLYVPDAWLDRLLMGRRARLERIAIYYEPGCGFCHKIVLLLRELFLQPEVSVFPASVDPAMLELLKEKQSWIIRGPDGDCHFKWGGITYLVKQNWQLLPLVWLMDSPLLARRLERLYDLIGRSRRPLGTITEVLLPLRSDRGIGRAALILCGFLALLALASNVNSLLRIDEHEEDAPSTYLDPVDDLARIFQVSQHWYLFAPVPSHFQRRFEVLAHMKDGSAKDLMSMLPSPPFRASAGGFDFAHHRWLKYLTQADTFTDTEWSALGRYLCHRAQQQSIDLARTRSAIEVIISTETIVLTPTTEPPKITRHSIDCSV
jgi:hypothetical protein